MKRRFHLPDSTHVGNRKAKCAGDIHCRCCAATDAAREQGIFDSLPEWNSPLTPGVQLTNLSHSEDGANLRVDLAADWGRMFEQLSAVGSALIMTRNAGAILGRRMVYPTLLVTSGRGKAASCESGLFLKLRQLGMARAVHLRRASGHVFGAEFSDRAGNLVHRVALTPESDMDEFFGWVRLHQACTAHRPACVPDEEFHGQRFERALLWRECDCDALISIVASCVDRQLPLRATVRGNAVTQRVDLTPQSLQPSEDWWFLSDDETGLHFHPGHFAGISIEKRLGENGEQRVVLCASIEDGASGLLLEAARPAAEDTWRDLLATVA